MMGKYGYGLAWALFGQLCLGIAVAEAQGSVTYYVDFTTGDDTDNGLTPDTAWKTIEQVNQWPGFATGDVVKFKRGETWNDVTLEIDTNEVTYDAYPDDPETGPAPHIVAIGPTTLQPLPYDEAVLITGSGNVVRNLKLSNGHEACIQITPTALDNTIVDNELTNCGTGVWIGGSGSIIAANNAHDMRMIVNTPCTDEQQEPEYCGDDYGAVCFFVDRGTNGISNIEILWNTGVNCRAESYDFVMDGGFAEFCCGAAGSSAVTNNVQIYYNWAERTEGFLEGHGNLTNIVIRHNIIANVSTANAWGGGLCLHGPGDGLSISNFRFENNTYYKTSPGGYRVFACWSGATYPVTVRNNIFDSNIQIADIPPQTHAHNLYHVHDEVQGSGVGYTLGTAELTGDPRFLDPVNSFDFHLTAGSPAVDAGIYLGYEWDYGGTRIPSSDPDIGAYEFVPER